jgi:hypothetical protein
MFATIVATAVRYAPLAGVALLAGALNSIAGGGSFFSFPTLLGFGLPPVNANATSTVALWPGQMAAIFAFRRELSTVRRMITPTIVVAAVGGVAGAVTLLHTGQQTFLALVPWLLLFGTVMFTLSSLAKRWLDRTTASHEGRPADHLSWKLLLAMTIVCFYIGYFGAGAGFLIISVLSVLSNITSIHQMNALKVMANLIANCVAVATFILAHAIHWREGLIMMLFAAAGGYFGAAYSLKINARYVRGFVIFAGFAISAYFFWKVYA